MKLYRRTPEDPAPLAQADPYLIKAGDGRYYLYATAGQVYSSDHLLEGWRYEGIRLHMPGQAECWAPSVLELDGTYYMYYSSLPQGSTDPHDQQLRLAVASHPAGPFTYVKDLLPPFSIDPHVVQTPSGLYIFYCNNAYEGERAGTRILCDRMTAPDQLEGHPQCVVEPTLDEEIFMRDRFRPGQHWHTIEGAFYFFHQGYHYLMYSGACYQNPTYFIGYCTAHAPQEADLRTLPWQKFPDAHTYLPLMKKNAFMEGMGHNSVLFDGGKCYIVYHGRDLSDAQNPVDTRCARIDEMHVDQGRLSVTPTP